MSDKTLTVPSEAGFDKYVSPVKIKKADELFLFACECKNVHFRHAGYLEMLMPFQRADKQKRVDNTSHQVMVCTMCRACYIWYNEQMYDVTDVIDLEAWVQAEQELHDATGPGGQC